MLFILFYFFLLLINHNFTLPAENYDNGTAAQPLPPQLQTAVMEAAVTSGHNKG